MDCEPQFPKELFIVKKGLSNKFVQSALEENDEDNEMLDDREPSVEASRETSLPLEPSSVPKELSETPVASKSAPSGTQGTGVSTFLEIDEHSELKHGLVTVVPCMNIGLLLDPLDEECASSDPLEKLQTFSDSMEEDRAIPDPIEEDSDPLKSQQDPSLHHTRVSLDEVLNLCQNVLRYTSDDLVVMESIYRHIDGGGNVGVTMETIEANVPMLQGSTKSVGDIVQDLINFEQVCVF